MAYRNGMNLADSFPGVGHRKNSMRVVAAVLLGAGLCAALVGQASASLIYSSSNGTKTFPGTYVGTVGPGISDVDQIGDLSVYNSGSGGAFVNSNSNPSIYEFYWGGGSLTIQEKIGNNGTGDALDVELDSLASKSSTSSASTISSTQIPFSSGLSSEYYVINNYDLAEGYYAIDTYLALGNATDPDYQVNFSVPEPTSMALFGLSLVGFGLIRGRRALKTA